MNLESVLLSLQVLSKGKVGSFHLRCNNRYNKKRLYCKVLFKRLSKKISMKKTALPNNNQNLQGNFRKEKIQTQI